MANAICVKCGKERHWKASRGARLADHRCRCGGKLRAVKAGDPLPDTATGSPAPNDPASLDGQGTEQGSAGEASTIKDDGAGDGDLLAGDGDLLDEDDETEATGAGAAISAPAASGGARAVATIDPPPPIAEGEPTGHPWNVELVIKNRVVTQGAGPNLRPLLACLLLNIQTAGKQPMRLRIRTPRGLRVEVRRWKRISAGGWTLGSPMAFPVRAWFELLCSLDLEVSGKAVLGQFVEALML